MLTQTTSPQAGDSLGTYYENGVQAPETTITKRWRLKRAVKRLLPESRTANCLERPAFGAQYVEIIRNESFHSATYGGLVPCGSVWTCPVCAQKITEERRRELTTALAAAKQQQLTPVLVTYTMSHHLEDKLEELLEGLLAAHRATKSGRAYQEFKSEWGIIGSIKSLEVTYGDNGWHPHVHELVFLDIPAGVQILGFAHILRETWKATLNKIGYDASYARGIDVRTADSDIADYVAKWGHEPYEKGVWGVETEITKAHMKKANIGGETPFSLLEKYADGSAQAGALFAEYARCFQGRKQLTYSPKLKERLKLEELATSGDGIESTPGETYAYIPTESWKQVLKHNLEAQLLELAARGTFEQLEQLAAAHGVLVIRASAPGDSPPIDLSSIDF